MNLKNIKIAIPNKETCKVVQEKLFELGVMWGCNNKRVSNITSNHLYVSGSFILTYTGGNSSDIHFRNHTNKEIHYKSILEESISWRNIIQMRKK